MRKPHRRYKMNKERRKIIYELIDKANKLKAEVEKVHDAEETAYDNMGDGLQNTMRGWQSEDAVDNLSEAVDLFDDIIEYLESAAV